MDQRAARKPSRSSGSAHTDKRGRRWAGSVALAVAVKESTATYRQLFACPMDLVQTRFAEIHDLANHAAAETRPHTTQPRIPRLTALPYLFL